jgi:hypothetical protein
MRSRPIVFAATHPSGGIGELWEDLALALAQDGYATGLLGFYPATGDSDGAAAAGWTMLTRAKPGKAGWPLVATRLHRWLAAERPALVVTAMPAANVLTPAMARLASPDTRVVLTHHSPATTHSPLLDRIDGATGLLPGVVAVAGVSYAVTRSLGHRPARYRAKLRTIRNALPPRIERLLDGLAPTLPRARAAGRRIVATGRLHHQKNYPFLLRAMAWVPDATLDIVGHGPDAAALEVLARELGIANRITFHGFCPREEALRILAGGDLFCQVSRYEGHSLALIEAAKLGLPLIVSDVPEQVEAVTARDGDLCGAVVRSDDDAGLAAAIERLLSAPDAYRTASADAVRVAAEARFADVVSAYAAFADRR